MRVAGRYVIMLCSTSLYKNSITTKLVAGTAARIVLFGEKKEGFDVIQPKTERKMLVVASERFKNG